MERLSREFDICDRHIQRIDEALEAMHTDIPMSVDSYTNLDENQIRCMDQFIFRFSQTSRMLWGLRFSGMCWSIWMKMFLLCQCGIF